MDSCPCCRACRPGWHRADLLYGAAVDGDEDLEVGQQAAAGIAARSESSVKVPVAGLTELGLVPVVPSTEVTGGVRSGR